MTFFLAALFFAIALSLGAASLISSGRPQCHRQPALGFALASMCFCVLSVFFLLLSAAP